MCNSMSSTQKGNVAKMANLSDTMISQAGQVFGADNAIFQGIKSAYDGMVAAGPSQQGFSQAERNALNSAVVTNDANAARFALGAARTAQVGDVHSMGGNDVTDAGVTNARGLSVAQEAAERTASDLNTVQQEDWATGRANFFKAADAEAKLPGIYDNMPGMDQTASNALQRTYVGQANRDSAGGSWKNAVMGLAETGINMVAPGLGTAIGTGLGTKTKQQGAPADSSSSGSDGNFFTNGLGNTSSDSTFGENYGWGGNFWKGMGGGTTD